MKNIHLIPTDKDSNLFIGDLSGQLHFNYSIEKGSSRNQHIYITNSEEIKEGDWYFITESISKCESKYEANDLTDICKKIILTTDPDLIKDSVQPISNEFLQWFVQNPSCEEVEVKIDCDICALECTTNKCPNLFYKIIIPKEEPKDVVLGYKTSLDAQMLDKIEPKQETLEEFINSQPYYGSCTYEYKEGIEEGAKWQQERMYSEEDMAEAFIACWKVNVPNGIECKVSFNEWFEQFKKK